MTVIRAHCRDRFTGSDVDFILKTLGLDPGNTAALARLLADPESRDQILDDEDLHRAILESPACLTISARLYFYVLIRGSLRRSGINERRVADYVAELLAEFTATGRTQARLQNETEPLEYFFEMFAALRRLEGRRAFELQAHMGNQALYYAGLFVERVEGRARRRGAPPVGYYERLGGASFGAASLSRQARALGLEEILGILSDAFHEIRVTLNDLADRVLTLGERAPNPAGPWIDAAPAA